LALSHLFVEAVRSIPETIFIQNSSK
jgi:hypothetical protein